MMNNEVDRILAEERRKWEEKRLRQKRIMRIIGAFFFPIFLALGILSAFSLWKALDTYAFLIISIVIGVFSVTSGLVEHIRIKKFGESRRTIAFLIQLSLFIGLCILLAIIIELLGTR